MATDDIETGSIDPVAISSGLVEREPGLWVARHRSPVPYPAEGNQLFAALEESSFWFRHRNRCILAVLAAHPPAGTLFDVGGGNGFVARALAAAGWPAILVEPGEDGVAAARRRGLGHVVCSTLEDADFHPGSLPAVGLFDVLEHLPDDVAVLAGLRRLLVPGGRLYVTVPAYRWLWSSEDEFAHHHRRYRLGELTERLERSDFRVLRATYFFTLLPLPILLARTLPSRLGLRRRTRAATTRREHAASLPGATRLLDRLLAAEAARLRRGRDLPFGASCLVVAEAPR